MRYVLHPKVLDGRRWGIDISKLLPNKREGKGRLWLTDGFSLFTHWAHCGFIYNSFQAFFPKINKWTVHAQREFKKTIYHNSLKKEKKETTLVWNLPTSRKSSLDEMLTTNQVPVARSMVRPNHWFRSIETYMFLWQLTLVSANPLRPNRAWGLFLKSPKTFRAYSECHNSSYIFAKPRF